jgi:hypothetical protein
MATAVNAALVARLPDRAVVAEAGAQPRRGGITEM